MNKTKDIAPPPPAPGAKADALTEQIGRTRSDVAETLTAIEQKLSPSVLREKAVEELHVVEEKVKDAVKEQFNEAKMTIKAELAEAKESVKKEIEEAWTQAGHAVRAATIGKVETMARRANDTTVEARDSLLDTVWQNPLPTALAGVGLVWLYMNRRGTSAASSRAGEYYQGTTWRRPPSADPNGSSGLRNAEHGSRVAENVQHKVAGLANLAGEAVSSAAHAAGRLVHDAGDATGSLAHQVSEGAGHLVHDAGEMGTQLTQRARDQARRVDDSLHRTMQANPLAVGAAVLAAGALVGLALPRTRREDALMGQTRDRLMDRARGAAHEAVGVARDITHDGMDHIKEAIR